MKTKVNILLDHGRFSNRSDFYPLYRWRKQLNDVGIDINFYSELNVKIYDADVIILSSRFFKSWQNITTRDTQSKDAVLITLANLAKYTDKLIWFDNSDGTGSTEFDIIEYVNFFWKKQLLIDKDIYTKKTKDSVRIWLPLHIQEQYKCDTNYEYNCCAKENLHKLKLAWNIGLNDYRFNNKYLAKLASLSFPNILPIKNNNNFIQTKNIDILNRGSVLSSKSTHSYQRNKLYPTLSLLKDKYHNKEIITNGFVSLSKYKKELLKSKMVISPFGWGEVCYKDFEIVLSGGLMLKPSMDHLSTFPNIYQTNEYIKLDWELHNLEEKIEYLFGNESLISEISITANNNYLEKYNDSSLFCNHFKNLIFCSK